MKTNNKDQVILYSDKNGIVELRADTKNDTLWATQDQISQLFEVERSVVTKHINNVFKDDEVDQKSNVQKMHIANSDKPIQLYNLDVIISVGYRVNSKRGTQFRIWATNVLKQHLIAGYTINDKRLKEQSENLKKLQRTVQMLADLSQRKALTILRFFINPIETNVLQIMP